MGATTRSRVQTICSAFDHDHDRLLDVLHAVQRDLGAVTPEDSAEIADLLGLPAESIEQDVSFFSAFTPARRERLRVQVADDPVTRMLGGEAIADAIAVELDAAKLNTHGDAGISLERTPLLGMADLGPVLRVNDTILPVSSPDDARHTVRELFSCGNPSKLVRHLGDGANAHPLVQSPVHNNIRQVGRLVLRPMNRGAAIRRALAMSAAEVIRSIKTARLRGRSLDSLPTGIKWGLVRSATIERAERDWGEHMASSRDYAREFDRFTAGERRFVICNACDAEPGLFLTRVLLTERPGRLFAGMTVAGYAVGADVGILYLADELAYLKPYLEDLLARRYADHLLGEDIQGRRGFHFDIRIHLGSGPYALGEETAVINACEGRPAIPRPRPPYPTQEGYHGWPTVVHGVETYCCVTKIMEEGAASFSELGTLESTGTKLICVSGDCRSPGLYEVPFGVTVKTVLGQAGAEDAVAAFTGGPNPGLLDETRLDREISFEDISTSGSVVAVGPARDPVRLISEFGRFYLEATSAFCGERCEDRAHIADVLTRLPDRRATLEDLRRLEDAAARIAQDRACGFGRAPGRLVLNSIDSFRELIQARLAGTKFEHTTSRPNA